MKRYATSTPRAAFGIAAIALAAITLSLSVFAPAVMNTNGVDSAALHASRASAQPSIEADIIPAQIEVVASREPTLVLTPVSYVRSPAGDRG